MNDINESRRTFKKWVNFVRLFDYKSSEIVHCDELWNDRNNPYWVALASLRSTYVKKFNSLVVIAILLPLNHNRYVKYCTLFQFSLFFALSTFSTFVVQFWFNSKVISTLFQLRLVLIFVKINSDDYNGCVFKEWNIFLDFCAFMFTTFSLCGEQTLLICIENDIYCVINTL